MWRVLQTCVWLSALYLLLLMERSASQVSVLTRNMLSLCSIPGLEVIFVIALVNCPVKQIFDGTEQNFGQKNIYYSIL